MTDKRSLSGFTGSATETGRNSSPRLIKRAIGLILGTGLTAKDVFAEVDGAGAQTLRDFGCWIAHDDKVDIVIIQRHGLAQAIAPHLIDHNANLQLLLSLNCALILSTSAVGSLNASLPVGTLVTPDDFVDLRGSVTTLFDGSQPVRHTDMTAPFSPHLRSAIRGACGLLGRSEHVVDGGVYACMAGPRYETPAEIRMLRTLGADLVGMTAVPEAIVAREAGIPYATLSIVTNMAAGMSTTPISHQDVSDIVTHLSERVSAILRTAIQCLV